MDSTAGSICSITSCRYICIPFLSFIVYNLQVILDAQFMKMTLLFYYAGIVCPELTAPENGSVVSDGFMSWGGTVEYSCNEGYALVGFKDRTCTREATWSNSEPTCESKSRKLVNIVL